MIYMVDIVYADPKTESKWNEYYGEHLRKLLSVPGFLSAQRFKAIGEEPSRFLAVYTVESAAVYDSARYKMIGGIGGGGSQDFRANYQSRTRNLFDGMIIAPKINEDQTIFVRDYDEVDLALTKWIGPIYWLRAAGLQMTTNYRAFAVLRQPSQASEDQGGFTYRPFTDYQT
jgi:hypothetical protein